METLSKESGQLVLEENHVHLIYTLLAALSVTDEPNRHRQAMRETAHELETKLAATQASSAHVAHLELGSDLFEKRLKDLDRKALKNELRSALNALGRAGRDFILNHTFVDEDKDESEQENTRKRKLEKFEALEEKFSELDQVRTKLKLSMCDDCDDCDCDSVNRQPSVEASDTPETKLEGFIPGAMSATETEYRIRGHSDLPCQPLATTKPTFPQPSDTLESARVSLPSPVSEVRATETRDLIDPSSGSGLNGLTVTRDNEERYAYASENGGTYKGIARVVSISEHAEVIDDRRSREASKTIDILPLFNPPRGPRPPQKAYDQAW